MEETGRGRWLGAVVLVGAVYLVVGVGFAALAGSSAPHQTQVAWRLAAWLASAAAFAAHIWHEHFRRQSPPRTTAWHAALAVALGACGIAVAANVHTLLAGVTYRPGLAIALVAWPVLTGVPAFLAAWVAATTLALMQRRA